MMHLSAKNKQNFESNASTFLEVCKERVECERFEQMRTPCLR